MGNKEDLATYQFQLGQIQEALDKEPTNAELTKLAGDLKELVELYTQLVASDEAAALAVAEKQKQQKKRSALSVTSTESKEVPRKKTMLDETVVVGELEPPQHQQQQQQQQQQPKAGQKGNGTKKKVNKREVEQNSKQAAWLNFAAKPSTKRAVSGGGLKAKSMFATADEPNSVVGVIGSGKGMTAYQSRGKHRFEDTESKK